MVSYKSVIHRIVVYTWLVVAVHPQGNSSQRYEVLGGCRCPTPRNSAPWSKQSWTQGQFRPLSTKTCGVGVSLWASCAPKSRDRRWSLVDWHWCFSWCWNWWTDFRDGSLVVSHWTRCPVSTWRGSATWRRRAIWGWNRVAESYYGMLMTASGMRRW